MAILMVTAASANPDCTAVRRCFHAFLSAMPCGNPVLQRLDPRKAAVAAFTVWYARRLQATHPKLPPGSVMVRRVSGPPKPRLIKTDPSPSGVLGSEPHRKPGRPT